MASFMAFPYAGDATMRARMAGKLKLIAVSTGHVGTGLILRLRCRYQCRGPNSCVLGPTTPLSTSHSAPPPLIMNPATVLPGQRRVDHADDLWQTMAAL